MMVSFDAQNFYFDEVQFIYFAVVTTCAFDVITKNTLPNSRSEDLSLFSSKRFTVLTFTLRSFIYFYLIFLRGVRNFIFFYVASELSQNHLCILVYNSFYTLLAVVYWYFVEDFCIYTHKRYLFVVFFFVCDDFDFSIRVILTLQNELGSILPSIF